MEGQRVLLRNKTIEVVRIHGNTSVRRRRTPLQPLIIHGIGPVELILPILVPLLFQLRLTNGLLILILLLFRIRFTNGITTMPSQRFPRAKARWRLRWFLTEILSQVLRTISTLAARASGLLAPYFKTPPRDPKVLTSLTFCARQL
jgi:hypothetical protein